MKVVALNKRAQFDYSILETFDAGIKLLGHEVKSVKQGYIKLQGAYVTIYKGEAYLANAYIPPYQFANKSVLANYDPTRFRKLLLTKKQLQEILLKRKAQRLVIVPIKVYLKNNLIKVQIGLAKPLRKYDKKQRRKEREERLRLERIKKTVEVRY